MAGPQQTINILAQVNTSQLPGAQAQINQFTQSAQNAGTASTAAGNQGAAAFQKLQAAAAGANNGIQKQVQLGRNLNDVFNSLASGAPPLQVLLIQGNQIREMYGGSIPKALQAVGGVITRFVTNPFLLAGAAIAAFVSAAYQGSAESTKLAQAIALTGNSAGVTTSYLMDMSKSIGSVSGGQAKAAEALTAVVKSGEIATSAYSDVTKAIIALERDGGQSMDKSIQMFEKLSEKPAESAAKLNKTLGFLNLATYERIKALEEQGKTEQAVALAQSTLADTQIQRMAAVRSQAGYLETAWNNLGKAASGAWNFMMGLGRAESTNDKLSRLTTQVQNREKLGPTNQATAGDYNRETQRLRDEINNVRSADNRTALNAQEGAIRQQIDKDQVAAKVRLDIQRTSNRSRAELRADELKQLKRDVETAGNISGTEYNERAQQILDKYKDPKGPKGPKEKAYSDDEGLRMVMQLKERAASLKVEVEQSEKLSGSEKERAEKLAYIAELMSGKILTAGQKTVLTRKDEIKALLDANVALEKQAKLNEEIRKIRLDVAKDAAAYDAFTVGAGANRSNRADSQNDQYDRELAGFGGSERSVREIQAQRAIRKEFEADLRRNTSEATKDGTLGSKEYYDEVARIKVALNDALDAQQNYFNSLKTLRGSWENGMNAGFDTFIDKAGDLSSQTKNLVENSLKGFSDGLTELATGGEFSFRSFAATVLKGITSMIIQFTIMIPIAEALKKAMNMSETTTSSGGGFWGTLFKGVVGAFGGGAGGGYSAADQAGLDGLVMGLAKAKGGTNMGAFRANGIASGPVTGYFGGQKTTMGESGAEAIIPLKRNGSGELGVSMMGGGGGSTNTQVNHITISGGNGNAQQDAQTASLIQRQLEKSWSEMNERATRPGGVNNPMSVGV